MMLPGRRFTIDTTLKILLRRRYLLAGPLLLGVLGGLVYSRSQPTLYRSDAVVQVVPQRIPESYVQSTVTERVEDRLSSIAQQVLSRTQLEAVIFQFDLYRELRRLHPMEDVFELMTQRIKVAPLESTAHSSRNSQVDAFRISFDYDNPRTSRDVVATLAGLFIDRNARERGSQADQTSAFLETQLADARSRLDAQEKKLKIFRERNSGRLPTQTQTNMQAIQNTQMALQALVESLARDRDRKLMLERLYTDAAADQPADGATPVASARPAGDAAIKLPLDAASRLAAEGNPRQRLELARSLLAQLELRETPKHPDVVRTKRLISELEQQVAAEDARRRAAPDAAADRPAGPEEARQRDRLREMRAETESLDRQIAFKESEEKRLRGEIGAYQARLEAMPGLESEWVALTRDNDTLQKSYNDLLAKSESSKMAASLEQRQIGEQFRILDPPRIPLRPESPNRIRINAFGTLAGLAFGLLLIGLLEYRDSTMRSEADVLGAIDLPLLALLPLVPTAADRRRQHRRRLVASAAMVAVLAGAGAMFWLLQLWKFIA